MKKSMKLLGIITLLGMLLSGCGKTYTCEYCGEQTKTAYYGAGSEILCEDCARDYYYPLPYSNYKVK